MDYNFKSATTQEKQSTSGSTSASKKLLKEFDQKPTPAFIGASWVVCFTGVISYCIGERLLFYHFTIWLVFSHISSKKCTRQIRRI